LVQTPNTFTSCYDNAKIFLDDVDRTLSVLTKGPSVKWSWPSKSDSNCCISLNA